MKKNTDKIQKSIYKGRCKYLKALKFQRNSVHISEITHVPRTCGHCWRHHWLYAHFVAWFQTEDLKEVLNLVDRTFEIIFLNSNVVLLPWSVTPWPLKVGGQVKWSPKVIDWFESNRLSLTLPQMDLCTSNVRSWIDPEKILYIWLKTKGISIVFQFKFTLKSST